MRKKTNYQEVLEFSTDRSIITGVRDKKVENLEIPCGVTSIAHNAFKDCVCLKNITVPSTLQRIGMYAFSGCTHLETVCCVNPCGAGFCTVEAGAFSGCSQLRKVIFNAKRMRFGDGVFRGCTKLKTLVFAYPQTTLTADAFKNSKVQKLIFFNAHCVVLEVRPLSVGSKDIMWGDGDLRKSFFYS